MGSTEFLLVISICLVVLAALLCVAAWIIGGFSRRQKDDWYHWRQNCRLAGRTAAKRRDALDKEEVDALLAPFESGHDNLGRADR